MSLYIETFDFTPYTFYLQANDKALLQIGFSPIIGEYRNTDILQETSKQLTEYFHSTRKEFELPIHISGSDFQMQVWKKLQEIPYGETTTYKQIATSLNMPNASRAVGMANNKNPLPIIIPCHRVIASNGQLLGYAGGSSLKEMLIVHEKKSFTKFN